MTLNAELFPCSQFPGSYTVPNDVYAYPSSDTYYSSFSMATRGIDEMYIYGGAAADATPPSSQTYVASVELGSLDEIWRTYLNNANITNEFYLQGAVYAFADGSLGATAAHQLFKLNATTGAVEAVVTLPTGDNPPGDSGSMKRNGKLTLIIVLGVISLVALSVSLSPILNLAAKAQGQNQTSLEMSQQVQQKLDELAQKFRGLVTSSDANLSLPQGGNLSESMQGLVDSAQFKNLTQQLSQQSTQLGINVSNIQNLQQQGGADFSGLVQKLQNLTSSRGG